MGKKNKQKNQKTRAWDPNNVFSQTMKSNNQKCMEETFEKMNLMDGMHLEDQKRQIRKSLLAMGTNCEMNDADPCGNGDQSLIQSSKARDAARELYSIGGDIHAHVSSDSNLISSFHKMCMIGSVGSVHKMIDECNASTSGAPSRNEKLKNLLECRETSMRLSPLLGIVSAGKNICLPAGMAQHEATAKLILKYGANPYAQDVLGKTVVHYGAGGMATEMTLNVVDICIHAAKTHHLFDCEVELFGLKTESWNGKRGIVGGYDVDSGRRLVYFQDLGKEVMLKPDNLRTVDKSIEPLNPLVDVQDRMGQVALLEVIQLSRLDVGKFLLEKHDASIHIEDADKISAFKISEGFGRFGSSVGQLVHEAAARQGKKDAKSRKDERRTICAYCKKHVGESGGKQCGACRRILYCGKDCQKQHWKNGHKQDCGLIAEGVKLDKPKSDGLFQSTFSMSTEFSSAPTNSATTGYRKPRGVKIDEKFLVKVQSCSDTLPIMVYDESRHCNFEINPGTSGFHEIITEMRKEPTWRGQKTFMKASFDGNNDCTVYPATATPKAEW